MSSQAGRHFRTFVCVLRDTRKSAHCLQLVGHSVSVKRQDTKWDAGRGMEEIHEFCFKEFAAVRSIRNFPVSVFQNIPYPHPFPLRLAITGTCRIGRRVCRMRCIALGALHAAGHVGERGRCIVRFDKAGALDGIFPVAGADGVDCHIQAGELLVLLHVKQVVLLVVFLRRLAGRDAEQPDWTVIPELVEELTGTGVQLLRDVGGGSKRYLSGSVAEIIVHNLHLHHADIGAGSAVLAPSVSESERSTCFATAVSVTSYWSVRELPNPLLAASLWDSGVDSIPLA